LSATSRRGKSGTPHAISVIGVTYRRADAI
jgi:hypothetical protein